MGAPNGNQFWKQRSKHGRDRIFETPEILWQAATEYFNWVDAHPWWKNEAVKSGDMAGEIIKVPTARPYTMQGLCLFLHVNTVYFNKFEKSLEGRKDDASKDYCQIITRIRETIFAQKFEGAAVGAFNANLIARELGLADKQEARHVDKNGNDVEPQPAKFILVKRSLGQDLGNTDDDELEIKETED